MAVLVETEPLMSPALSSRNLGCSSRAVLNRVNWETRYRQQHK